MKIQLSMDARKFLNVLIIRRLHLRRHEGGQATGRGSPGLPIEACVYPDMREAAAPADTGMSSPRQFAGKNAMTHKSLMKKSLPSLDTERLESLMARMPQSHGAETAADEGETRPETTATTATESSKRLLMWPRRPPAFARCCPDVRVCAGAARRSPTGRRARHERRRRGSAKPCEADLRACSRSLVTQGAQNLRPPAPQWPTWTARGHRSTCANWLPRFLEAATLARKQRRQGGRGRRAAADPVLRRGGGGIGREKNRLQRLMDKIAELDAKARKAAADDEFLAPAPAPPTHPQPGVTALGGLAARMSDARPPERRCLGRVPLAAYSPIWNDLAGDIDADTVKELDSGLFKGQESHLDFTSDELIEPCVDELSLTGVLASSSLYRRNRERVINERLRKLDKPPWAGTGREPRDWAKPGVFRAWRQERRGGDAAEADAVRQRAAARQETAPRPGVARPGAALRHADGGLSAQRSRDAEGSAGAGAAQLPVLAGAVARRAEPEDYKRYLATQETDYLGLVFHMYDSEDDEDEEAIERQRQEAERRQRDAERQKRLDALLAEKNEFSPGFWNTRAIFMGGLGRDPELPEEAEAAEVAAAAAAAAAAAEAEAEADVAAASSSRKAASRRRRRWCSRRGTLRAQRQSCCVRQPRSLRRRAAGIDLVGAAVPDRLRLDMVIKYSKLPDLEAALAQWELTVAAILRRESILAELEAFERAASDPARFRARGHRGSSQARLEESAKREELLARLSGADEAVKAPLEVLETRHGDVATFRMRWDKIEMLYWLQEERRRPMESLAEASPRSRASPVLPPIT
uniref:INCENP_ARK-bind domain-containing protein n=1 Tax=Macrostomum lignano TaxID=282301 RepID=A0A1I8HEI8_9PLAT